MSAAYKYCPSCDVMLLNDSAYCPSCRYVFDRSELEKIGDIETVFTDGQTEDSCQQCGEMVREGLVRCWNCQAFMRQDIEAIYNRMQSTPQPVIYSPLPDAVTTPDETESTYRVASHGSDDDFELGGNTTEISQDDDGFEMGADQSFAEPEQANPPEASVDADEASPAADETETPAEEATEEKSTEAADDQPAHSDATAGDILLQVALDEEAESVERAKRSGVRRRKASDDGILVYCPNGHRIEVQQRHMGKTGRCPKCKELYTVPAASKSGENAEQEPEDAADQPRISEEGVWIHDVRLHVVDPLKLKLKPGSLNTGFTNVDVWLRPEGIRLMTLAKSGRFGSGSDAKSREASREQLVERIDEGTPFDDLPTADQIVIDPDQATNFKVVQPAIAADESIFHGVPVFGEGRVAVRVPDAEGDPTKSHYLSCGLSGFRTFSKQMAVLYQVDDLGQENGIPLEDSRINVACNYSEQLMKPLENIEFYEADENIELELIGWRCSGCQLVVSEDARKKEKIGGASGRGIAKAKCPKCKQAFGKNPLYTYTPPVDESEDEPEED